MDTAWVPPADGWVAHHRHADGFGENGVSHSTAEPDGPDGACGYIGSLMGFCVCGRPEDALLRARRIMRVVANLKDLVWTQDLNGRHPAYEAWKKQVQELFHGDLGAEYLAWYWLDDKGLTEHGGGVPGWLTDKGERILRDLDSLAPYLEAQAEQ